MNEMDHILFVVGTGPGNRGGLTADAARAIAASDVIVGYSVYNDLIRPHFPDKEYLTTPMRGEEKRCILALEAAAGGKRVSLISSGDAGVYGLAGLVLTLAQKFPQVAVKIVPGVTASSSGAALLGAPLVHDYASVSLSDALTPWEKIEKRLTLAAEADFVIVLYNPASRRRRDHLARAAEILLKVLPETRPCGLAHRIGRDGEAAEICTLADLPAKAADMFTTVFIGNSQTRVLGGRLVTPRGYAAEQQP